MDPFTVGQAATHFVTAACLRVGMSDRVSGDFEVKRLSAGCQAEMPNYSVLVQAPIFFKATVASDRTASSGSLRALRKDGTASRAGAPISPRADAACLRRVEAV